MPAPVIDWIVAEWIAGRIAGNSDAPAPTVDLAPIVADAEQRVVAYTGLVPDGPLPPPEGLSRREWVATNIASTRALIDPMLDRLTEQLGPVKPAAQLWLGFTGSAEVGLLIGYLSQRVLGQYEFVLLKEHAYGRPPRLLFVLPNLGGAVKRFDANEREFVTWVALHEVTHAVQFAGVPWLQDHLADLIRELIDSAETRMSARRRLHLPSREALERVGRAALKADFIGMVASEPERDAIDRAQAVMAVIEGHAEHVMDAVAPELLPSLPDLRKALDERRKVQSPMGRLVSRVLGLEMKLKQYERGKIFCDEIVRVGGSAALRQLFSAPEALPTLVEIEDPAAWLRRSNLSP
ncbi:MAG TPA: zinc-dependent metalloprotease [Solirubrobacteraceae bacterium]|nr:zinc-dependent metalloprotease [Solirubrobacteraceae bacterium]